MDTFDMVVMSNLHCPLSSSCVLNPSPVYPASFLSLTFLVFFLTMICLYERNVRTQKFASAKRERVRCL